MGKATIPIPEITSIYLERFYNRIKINPNNKCWEWIGYKNGSGYGLLSIRHIDYLATRIAYKIYYGVDPDELYVLHECDNPACVKKEHLFLGDNSLNILDAWQKKRRLKHSNLHDQDIYEIHELSDSGKSHVEIAKLKNISRSYVTNILSGRKRVLVSYPLPSDIENV